MLIRRLLLLCAMGLMLASPAWATTTISSATTNPVKTSTTGDLNIDLHGSVAVDTSGAAVTVDSNNILSNSGTISNKATTGAIGILLQGGGANSSLTLIGNVDVEGKDATGGIGIEVAPTGYTGEIDLHQGSTVTVSGTDSKGIAIFGPLVGNVTFGGTILAVGQNAMGVITTGPITGSITNSGVINAEGTTTPSTTTTNPSSGSALAVGGSISGGIYNVGPDSVHTAVTAAIIEAQGSAPALYISPSLAGASATDVLIGVFADPEDLNEGFSLLNRGTIRATGFDPGVDATAMLIEGDDSGHTATLTGGIFNSGTISVIVNSGDKSTNASDADSIAIEIGSGGIVPRIDNTGTIASATDGLGGGSTTAILIDAGGSLESLDNGGSILAIATTTNVSGTLGVLAACAICDFSGTLTSLINSGTIRATATALDADNQVTIAADLSHVAAGTSVVFVNTGNVLGDVLFGASDDKLDVKEDGFVNGDVSFGSGANELDIIGTTGSTPQEAIVDGAISYDATGGGTLDIGIGANGELITPSADASSLNVAGGGTIVFVLGSTGPAPGSGDGIITTTGNATFAAGSRIGFSFDSSLPDTGNFSLISAGGTLTFPTGNTDPTQNVGIFGVPFLYTMQLKFNPTDANELDINFARKTAQQLGLTGNEAAIYDPAVEAARGDKQFGAALMNLFSQQAVNSSLLSLEPDVSGDTRAIAIALTDQATGAVGARQRTLLEYTNASAGLNLWGQEYIHSLNNNGDSATAPGYKGSGFGFAMGADGGSPNNGRYGGAFTFFAGNVTENKPRDSKTDIEWYMLSLYSDWRGKVLFFNTQANAGYGSFTGMRKINVGTLKRTATGDWSDYLVSGGFSTGFIFTAGSFVFMPEWNVDGLYVSENAYDEKGAHGENLSIDSRKQKSLRTFVGLVLRDNIDLGDGYLQPELRGGWSYDFLNDPEDLTASFAGAPVAPKFTLTGPTPAASRIVGGASLSWAYRSWSLGINYDLTSSAGALAHSGTLTVTGRI